MPESITDRRFRFTQGGRNSQRQERADAAETQNGPAIRILVEYLGKVKEGMLVGRPENEGRKREQGAKHQGRHAHHGHDARASPTDPRGEQDLRTTDEGEL